MMKKWRVLLASGESGEIEARLRRHDGVYRWFLIRVEPFRDERGQLLRWYGTSTDIDTLKQTQEKLREDEQELRQITDAIPQAIVVLGARGRNSLFRGSEKDVVRPLGEAKGRLEAFLRRPRG